MIGDRIRALREDVGLSQSELARRLSVTRASVNAWESGLSAPTAAYIVELAKLFRVSTDFILGIDASRQINISDFTAEERHIIYSILEYFGKKSNNM